MVKNQYGEDVPERLDLAYREISSINSRILDRFGPYVKELDLSNNNLEGDLKVLEGFSNIHTLVLDHNKITSHSKFAILPKLHTLWVNSNQINNLSVFVDKIKESFINLKVLSMLKNEACPNYFNGHSLKDYKDYRCFVISKIKTLQVLDATPITDQEREEALKIYGNSEGSTSLSKVTGPNITIAPKDIEIKEDDPKQKRLDSEKKKKDDQTKRRKDREDRRERRKKKAEDKADKGLEKDQKKKKVDEERKAKEKLKEDEFTDSEDESKKILDTNSPRLPIFSSDQAPINNLPPPSLPNNRKAYGDMDEADDEALTNNTQDSESDRDLPIHSLKLNNNIHLPPPNGIKKNTDDEDDEEEEEEEDSDDTSSEWSSDDEEVIEEIVTRSNQIPSTLKKYEEDDDSTSLSDDDDEDD